MAKKQATQAQRDLINEIELAFGLISTEIEGYKIYQDNPIGFIETELGVILTTEQKQICESIRDNRETNVQAAHGIGKFSVCFWVWYPYPSARSSRNGR